VTGIVSQKSVEPGQFVQPGQLLMAIVPLQNVWVVANFKETQVGHMRPRQQASIRVDSYPGMEFPAEVQSIGAATGASFSPPASGKCHRQLCQGGAARAGQDRFQIYS